MALAMEQLRRVSCIRGHHIYKNIWNPAFGEVLVYGREPHNIADQYSIAITIGGVVVGRLPQKLFEIVFAFFTTRWYNTLHSDWSEKTLHKSVVNFHCWKFCVFNFWIPAGHPKIFVRRKFPDLHHIHVCLYYNFRKCV